VTTLTNTNGLITGSIPLSNLTTNLIRGDGPKFLISNNLLWRLAYCSNLNDLNIWPCVTNGLVISQVIGGSTHSSLIENVFTMPGTVRNGTISYTSDMPNGQNILTFEAYGGTGLQGYPFVIYFKYYIPYFVITNDGILKAYNPMVNSYVDLSAIFITALNVPNSNIYLRYPYSGITLWYSNMVAITYLKASSSLNTDDLIDSISNSATEPITYTRQYEYKKTQTQLIENTNTLSLTSSLTMSEETNAQVTVGIYKVSEKITITMSASATTTTEQKTSSTTEIGETNTLTLSTSIPPNKTLRVYKRWIQTTTILGADSLISTCSGNFNFCVFLPANASLQLTSNSFEPNVYFNLV